MTENTHDEELVDIPTDLPEDEESVEGDDFPDADTDPDALLDTAEEE